MLNILSKIMSNHRWAIAMIKSGGRSGEEKLEFTTEGEAVAYISLEQATLLAMEHARRNTKFYGWQYLWRRLVWQLDSADEGEEYYEVNLSFHPARRSRGSPGVEQFIIDKVGNIRMRQVLDRTSRPLETLSGDFTFRTGRLEGFCRIDVARRWLDFGPNIWDNKAWPSE